MDLTRAWTEELAARRATDLDASGREALRRLLVDALSIASAGSQAEGVRETVAALAGLGEGDVPVPWTELRLDAPQAGLATSALIHAWDFDDTHDEAVVHTSAVALPAALAVGLREARSGADVLDGVVVGVQVLARLSRLVGPQHGMIRTAGLGALAAAAAAARTMGLTGEQLGHAVALVLTSTGSRHSRQVVADSATNKRLQPGLAVQAGITAAYLARAGVTGPAHWLDGDYGVARLAAGEPDLGVLLEAGWEGSRLSLKPYPACRYTHSAITATSRALAALPAGAVVERADVHVPAGAGYAMVSRPFARRGAPIVDAQFSIPWLVAAHVVTGRLDLRTVAGPDLLDPEVEALAASVEVHQDQPETSEMVPATVELHTTAGMTVSGTAPMLGSPEEPMDDELLEAKAAGCFAVAGIDPAAGNAAVRDVVGSLAGVRAGGLDAALAGLATPHPFRTTTQETAWTSA
ncbi:MmgE/PrpD family protein [Rothia sp. ARF10]|nr:MmgE/PrpD family protein [Rothia sp. ARF10]